MASINYGYSAMAALLGPRTTLIEEGDCEGGSKLNRCVCLVGTTVYTACITKFLDD